MSTTSMAELKEIVAELSRSTKELRESFRESQATAGGQMTALRESQATAGGQMTALRESQATAGGQMTALRESQAKTDWQIAETSKELKKFMGSVGSEWGHLVESLTEPSCLDQLRAAGIDVTQKAGETLSSRPGCEQEWDTLLIDGDELVAVEVKSRFRSRDLDRMEEKLGKFKKAFPQYGGYRVYGAVAAIKYDAGLNKFAAKRGLFVFQPSGEIMKLANEPGFKPKAY